MNAIEVQNVSKEYTFNPQQTARVSLRYLLHNFSFFKKPKSFVALDAVSFSVKKGEALGIVGPNGCGKSTLLRVIGGITHPTAGNIIVYGRTTSLLSLGLGFHMDLTGRENIFLNAAILGYPKKKVEKQLHAIIAFAGLEEYIDMPVKYYSTGMYARLGFAIATAKHLDPDILLVDEIFAVGDREFHKKSFMRIKALVQQKKTTILFVSHDTAAIEELCEKTLWIEKGKVKLYGKTKDVIRQYKKTYTL